MIHSLYKERDKTSLGDKASSPDSDNIYFTILNNIDPGIIVLDIKGKEVVFLNKSAIAILGTAINYEDYEASSSLLVPDMEKNPTSGDIGRPKTLYHGSQIIGYTVYTLSDEYIFIIIRDITEKTRFESIAEAVNIMDNIGYIFSGIRHEIGNPINSIKMTMSVLKHNLGNYSTETVREYVDRTLTEISRVEYLLRALKSFSMFEKPNIKGERLPAFIAKVLSLVADDFERNGITIRTIFSSEAEWILTDPRALHQVMLNVMTNASDALAGRQDPQIVISTHRRGGLVTIGIADNGSGMPENVQRNLFRPFYTTKPHGTGLGLVIAKKMLSQMNSNIEIKSRENIGTTVTIYLPEGRSGNP